MNRKRTRTLNRLVLAWYRASARRLPWRKTRNPYRILVSEIMLQQTQVGRVLEKYPAFLKQFPSFQRLAEADTSAVLRGWRGMGYNNRAVRLQRLARIVFSRYHSRLPSSIQSLMSLPGVGRYTAHAIACFVFDQPVPVVDTNIRRVLTRWFPREAASGDIWKLAHSLLPRRNAYAWNQALMDFGALICMSTSPRCPACPIRDHCPSAFLSVARTPGKRKREAGRNGVPNRIYRGRIIDALRDLNQQDSITTRTLGRRIMPTYSGRDQRWLVSLLEGLQRDGLIRLRRKRNGQSVSFAE